MNALTLIEATRAIFSRDGGTVVVFGNNKYAEIRLIREGIVVLALGIACT